MAFDLGGHRCPSILTIIRNTNARPSNTKTDQYLSCEVITGLPIQFFSQKNKPSEGEREVESQPRQWSFSLSAFIHHITHTWYNTITIMNIVIFATICIAFAIR